MFVYEMEFEWNYKLITEAERRTYLGKPEFN